MEDTFSLGLTATALLVLRMIMIPFVIYNLLWSARSVWDFMRGRNFPSCLYESMVFFMCSGLAGYHVMAFMGNSPSSWSLPFSLALQCIFFLAVIIAALGKRLALTTHFEKFYWLLSGNNLDVAVRAAHLNELDSEYTMRSLEAAETTLAVRLAKKAINGEYR
jgi:hypothetical protein